MWFSNIFSKPVAYLFILLTVSFKEQKFLFLMKSSSSFFSFMNCAFWWSIYGTACCASCHLAHTVCQSLTCHMSSQPQMPISMPPTSLDECFFFNSLVVGLPYSLIFLVVLFVFVFKLVVIFLLVLQACEAYLPIPPCGLKVPTTIYWRDCIYPIVYSSLHYLRLIDHISMDLFLGYFVTLIYMSVFMPYQAVITIAL